MKLDGAYWRRHARQPVEFAKSVRTLAELNCKLLVEIGPRPAGSAESRKLARRLRKLDQANVDMRVYPSEAVPPRCAGCAAFVEPLPEAAILMKALERDAAELPPVGLPGGKGVSLSSVRVTVLNGGGQQGAAARAAADLQRLGVRVTGTGNAPKRTGAASNLAYPPALEEQARLLQSLLGNGVKLDRSDAARGLVLTVGTSFRL